ncbi:hypothetical protein [Streptomyces sp. CA-132043]|uniref:hypothetical protein n=1 Tax=Streptomyces sp. CA-132043 TaxID=3240048 RepID=UPI003D94A963
MGKSSERPGTTGGGAADGMALAAAVRSVLARVDAHAARGRATGAGTSTGATAGTDTGDGPAADDGSSAGVPSTAAATTTPGTAVEPAPAASAAPAAPNGASVATLDALTTCFGLSSFEREIILLAAAAELDPTTNARCAAAAGDPTRAYPTLSLALAALAEPHWSALTPVAPLRRWRLVELEDETRLTTTRLRLDERILHFLVGTPYLDARLHGLLRRTTPPAALPPSYDAAADRVSAGWSGAGPDSPLRVELVGADLRTRADIAATAARRSGLGLYSMAADDVPTDPAERDRLARLWQREAILLPAALLIEVGELDRDQHAAADAFIAGAAVPLVVSSPDPRRTEHPGANASPSPNSPTRNTSPSGPTPSPKSPR